MSLFSFSTPLDIDIVLQDTDDRPTVDVKLDKTRREKAPLYLDGETVKGAVTIRPKDGKRLEHTGIKVQFVGTIEMFFDRSTHHEFLSLQTELASPGELQHPVTLPFAFKNVEKMYESYHGINVRLRYFLRVTVSRRMADVVREKDLWVYSYRQPPESNSVIKMDVGIEDCLHIEFEYSKSKYHLKDVIVGRIYFLLVRLKIKHMELSIIRRETTGVPPNQYNESETLVRFEIMDGSPSRGETIPIRLFLGGFDLTPTFRDVNKKYSTRYYLSLVLIDEDARRYFKQSEIVLYRQAPENRRLGFDADSGDGDGNRAAGNSTQQSDSPEAPVKGHMSEFESEPANSNADTPRASIDSTASQAAGFRRYGGIVSYPNSRTNSITRKHTPYGTVNGITDLQIPSARSSMSSARTAPSTPRGNWDELLSAGSKKKTLLDLQREALPIPEDDADNRSEIRDAGGGAEESLAGDRRTW
ncbi:Vacuolar protein sorting-associated protein 26 [Oleoguttula sp. CCFEE 5521]